ncbi:MAG: glycosyltransferase family 2 protein [Planctomycetes bacterium]|nr:glycosyltransferase family 2 protein [Planctomycetota bacterium]
MVPALSIVVPVYNEEESLDELHAQIVRAVLVSERSAEVIYVDDHSRDKSLAVLLRIQASDPRVRVIRFRRNFGQTAALAAGFDYSRGQTVVTLDADLQNDPADIPKLLAELDRGYDVVAGWRKSRRDGFLLRRLPSIVANRLIAWVTGTSVHDTGCTLKAFRRQVVKNLPIYAEQHRFLPAMTRQSGARVSEVVVNHRPRIHGQSKYGIGRAARVFLDLFTIKMIAQFAHRPLHYFGLFSLPFAAISMIALVFGVWDYRRMRFEAAWPDFVVLVVGLFLSLALYFILLGLLSELAVSASGMHRRRVLDRILNDHE